MNRNEILSMYRMLLKLSKKYPSIKHDSINKEIKIAFRESVNETDPKKIKIMLDEGVMAYTHMRAYVESVPDNNPSQGINLSLDELKKRYSNLPWNYTVEGLENL